MARSLGKGNVPVTLRDGFCQPIDGGESCYIYFVDDNYLVYELSLVPSFDVTLNITDEARMVANFEKTISENQGKRFNSLIDYAYGADDQSFVTQENTTGKLNIYQYDISPQSDSTEFQALLTSLKK
jgi:hypothetical protein